MKAVAGNGYSIFIGKQSEIQTRKTYGRMVEAERVLMFRVTLVGMTKEEIQSQ